MPKLTVLELVQRTLSAMDSDRVDEIDETEESVQVAEMARDVYYEIINDGEWPFLHGALRLTSPADLSRPTALEIEDEVRELDQVLMYNVADAGQPARYREVHYVDPAHFFRLRLQPKDGDLWVQVGDNLGYYAKTDRHPEYWTSLDDGTIYVDAVNKAVETTVQSVKTLASGVRIPEFQVTDSFVPELPSHFFPMYLAKLRQAAFLYFKNSNSPRDQAIAVSQQAQVRRKPNRAGRSREGSYFNTNFGRR